MTHAPAGDEKNREDRRENLRHRLQKCRDASTFQAAMEDTIKRAC